MGMRRSSFCAHALIVPFEPNLRKIRAPRHTSQRRLVFSSPLSRKESASFASPPLAPLLYPISKVHGPPELYSCGAGPALGIGSLTTSGIDPDT